MKRFSIIALILVALLSGCAAEPAGITDSGERSNAADNIDIADNPGGGGGKDELSVMPAAETVLQSSQNINTDNDQSAPPQKRMIVRDAELSIESGSPGETLKKVTDIATSLEGYIVESSNNLDTTAPGGNNRIRIVIRVPAAKFPAAVEEIKKSADRVVNERITGKDITEEFVDIQARLKAKRALEERFLEIMKQAKNVKDALDVQRELSNVRTEIERIEGRKRLLESQASLSKITVSIGPPNSISSSSTGFWYQLQEALSDGVEAALTIILVLVRVLIALIPLLLIIVLPLLLIVRYLWKRYKKYRVSKAVADESIELDKGVIDIE